MKKLLLLAENAFAILALQLFTGAWLFLLYQIITGRSVTADANQGILAIQLPFYGIYIITLLLITLRWKKIFYALVKEPLLVLLVGIALVSILWSYEPSITLRRSVALLGTTMFGVYLATRYSLKEQLYLLAWSLGLAAVSSLVFCLAFPNYGIMQSSQGISWQGVYMQKNVFGLIMVLSAFVFLLEAMSNCKYRYLMWAGTALSVSLILLSSSKNALVLFLTILILLPLYKALRWNLSWMLLFFIVAIIALSSFATVIVSNLENTLGLLGRDLTFTGRTELWAAVLDKFKERPWLGYGYSAFWLGLEGESSYVWRASTWHPNYAHNGFLDLLIELGLLGMFVYVLSFLSSYGRGITLARWTKTSAGLWPIVYLTLALISNFSDSTILKQNNIFWVLYVAVSFSTCIASIKDDAM